MSFGAVSRLVSGVFDESRIQQTAVMMREELGQPPTLGFIFASPDYMSHMEDLLEVVRLHARVPTLVGCSAIGLIGRNCESEAESGFSLLLLSLPGVQVKAVPIPEGNLQEVASPEEIWEETGLRAEKARGWIVLADPFQIAIESWLQQWNLAYPGIPIIGALSSGIPHQTKTWVYLNDHLVEGGVALGFSGPIEITTLVSQGCRPIGDPMTVTRVEENVLYGLGTRPALEVLNGAFNSLSKGEKEKAQGQIFAGLAVNEYVDDFQQGNFLVRNIFGADPQTGAVAIGGFPRLGQTLQYQLRDASAASEDLTGILQRAQKKMVRRPAIAALLFSCTGRGRGLFGAQHHDAQALDEFFPEVPVAGFFANGEIGPIGDLSYVHGYSAAIAFFRERKTTSSAPS